MLGCDVNGRGEERLLADNTRDVGDHTRLFTGYEMRDCELGHADRMGEVYV